MHFPLKIFSTYDGIIGTNPIKVEEDLYSGIDGWSVYWVFCTQCVHDGTIYQVNASLFILIHENAAWKKHYSWKEMNYHQLKNIKRYTSLGSGCYGRLLRKAGKHKYHSQSPGSLSEELSSDLRTLAISTIMDQSLWQKFCQTSFSPKVNSITWAS